jgi:type I restriction-modification system DNA methylase subunit
LREQLDRLAGGRATERLRNGFSAWPRLLALFQLVDRGCSHEALPVPRYGGGLFTPGNPDAKDAILRSLSAFEHPENAPSDAVIYRILELLCRSKVKVRQGRSTTWVEAPVDFSDLSSEYIGILYEGLLDFELRRAGEDDPMIFLNLGDEPVLPLARLEGMDNAALSNLVEKLKQKSKLVAGEDSEAEEEETEEVEEEAEEEIEEDAAVEADIEELEADIDKVQQLRERAHQWAMRAVEAGKLVAKPRGKKAEALTRYQQEVSKAGDRLIARIVLPGEWFLVRWGGTRKGSGTFYTRPQLAIPTTRRTLQPLAYQGELPKLPEEILALKVCDPAMGSGSFPVAALRFLTDALYESLHYHNRIEAHGDKTLCRLAEGGGTNSLLEETLPVLPDADDFEERLKARLKRYIVERCVYGVDLDPLAVELARLSLWVETMDRTLPFSFLDHKLKCGNSLVGCWFDRFQDYPAMAWERKGGDENHEKFIYHFREFVVTQGKKQGEFRQKGDKWNQAIKDIKNSVVKKELKTLLESLMPGKPRLPYSNFKLPAQPTEIHEEAQQIFQDLHGLPIDYSSEEQKENRYQKQFRESEAIQLLKLAFDTWCAVWFWPGEEIEIAPTPARFFNPPPETTAIIEQLAQKYQFFHWELEFPDVFASANAGFDGIIGNPPWEIQKPNSMEFFSNVDPLYRTYGKQEALNKQLEYFKNDAAVERDWLAYCDRLKALSNWNKYVGFPFGDEADGGEKFSLSKSKKENQELHEVWRKQRRKRQGYAEPCHPFQHQGSADINTYKMFLELSLVLLHHGGRMGMIVPSGIYTDKGATNLRTLFLSHCQWQWLFGFENRDGIFNIHRSFKFCPVILEKGEKTEAIQTTFMQRDLTTWEEAEKHVLAYSAAQVEQFSPKSKAILEIKSERDLAILEKMYANSVLLGDDSPQGWGIQYATEFHMTNDSELFPSRPKWEAKGYCPDEYGHWLKGNWQPYEAGVGSRKSGVGFSILQRPEGVILSADGSSAIHIDEVEDVALPLYQGVMIQQFDFSSVEYLSGSGLRTKWKDTNWSDKQISSQYLISLQDVRQTSEKSLFPRIAFRDVQNAANQRTMIACIIPVLPCGNTVPTLTSQNFSWDVALLPVLTSFPLDKILRMKMSQNHVSWFYAEELPIPNF